MRGLGKKGSAPLEEKEASCLGGGWLSCFGASHLPCSRARLIGRRSIELAALGHSAS